MKNKGSKCSIWGKLGTQTLNRVFPDIKNSSGCLLGGAGFSIRGKGLPVNNIITSQWLMPCYVWLIPKDHLVLIDFNYYNPSVSKHPQKMVKIHQLYEHWNYFFRYSKHVHHIFRLYDCRTILRTVSENPSLRIHWTFFTTMISTG